MKDPEKCNVAAVIGNTVKIFGPSTNGFRPYISQQDFSCSGKAKEFAMNYDEQQRTDIKQH